MIVLAGLLQAGVSTSIEARAQSVSFTPARLVVPDVPAHPQTVIGGGEVLLEVEVGADGSVGEIEVLRDTAPFTDLLLASVRSWQFEPAEVPDDDVDVGPTEAPEVRRKTASSVLVGGVFRAPALTGPTLGEVPSDRETPTAGVPFPVEVIKPTMPPGAFASGVVLVEVLVGTDGRVEDASVVRSDPAFDSAALDTAQGWRFRPARVGGRAVTSRAYLVFGFQLPVIVGRTF
jgi:TonB family protein